MSIYLDASAILPSLVDEPMSDSVQRFLASHPDRLISDFAAAEVAAALSRMVRTQQLDVSNANLRLADFDAWRAATSTSVDLRAVDARLAGAYVRRFDLMLHAPDALHLALARRVDATLVTLDRRMARAAEELGISVAMPTA
ncbi:MAG TPA: type II toxin-antitoxin system VapC family toxin [Stellaceae bacterium]|nr:type II toxin-antitoxin system VapC family toxin [Stellaceae bacterium]